MSENALQTYGIGRYYDELAGYYRWFYDADHLHYGYFLPGEWNLARAVRRMSDVVLDALGVNGDAHVLDAGCGVGGTSWQLHARAGCRVTGVSVSDVQLALARRGGDGDGKVRFEHANYTALPFADGVFSHVFALESSCYADDKQALLAELKRVVRQGGRVVIADAYTRMPEAAMTRRQREIYRTFNRGFKVPHLPHGEAFGAIAEAVGLKVLENRDITAAIWPTTSYMKNAGLVALPVAHVLTWLRLAPPSLIDHLWTCIVQREAFATVLDYRLWVLEA